MTYCTYMIVYNSRDKCMTYESYELAKHTLRYTLCTLPEKAVFSNYLCISHLYVLGLCDFECNCNCM